MSASIPAEPALVWHDVSTWGAEGRAFDGMERKRWFDRLPALAEDKVSANVWNYSRDSAGMLVSFKTDATTIWVDYALLRERPVTAVIAAAMTAVGISGIDLYARDDSNHWRWVGISHPGQQEVRQALVADMSAGSREYRVYLPLYNGVERLSIGVPPGASFEPIGPRTSKPIVFYGTSITQGASASRPGMSHTAILGRRLDRPVINLGFSGHGRMETSVGELLAKIDAAVYVIDCLPNLDAHQVRERCIPLVTQLRAARPGVPIILVEDRRNANAWVIPKRNQHHVDNHAALAASFLALLDQGFEKLFYISGDGLLGHDSEGTTDGSHPNDLGFVRQADQFEPVLRKALEL